MEQTDCRWNDVEKGCWFHDHERRLSEHAEKSS